MPNSALPPNLRKGHNDYIWPLSLIPRGLTAWKWGKPKMIAGKQAYKMADGSPMPIGEPKSFQVSYFPDAPWWAKPFSFYFSCTLKSGRHFRVGARYDDVDDYTQWPSIAMRKFPPETMQRDTSS